MANTDPFSSSVIPFEVPEQMRAFAEKGVSQARDNYAKFKDAAETHNGTIEAVFSVFSNGAKEYSAKVMEMTKEAASANLDFAQALVGVKSPSEAMELWTSHARKSVRGLYRAYQGTRRADPEGRHRQRRADQGQRLEDLQAAPPDQARRSAHWQCLSAGGPGRAVRAFCLRDGAWSPPRGYRRQRPTPRFSAARKRLRDRSLTIAGMPSTPPRSGLAKARRCT